MYKSLINFNNWYVAYRNDRKDMKNNRKISIEWKEVSRRIDLISSALTLIIVILAPIYIFSNELLNSEKKNCDCYLNDSK